ncbi:MAG: hypothetical protein HRS57_02365, partial [Mycoplasmataceae bacterium]|nr:hypothetical protein [Mycoplasmataceae bacterium]
RDKVSAFENADFIFIGLPTQAVETVMKSTVLPNITKPAYFVNLSKGLDYITVNSISEKLETIIPSRYNLGVAKLSGPSFASELVQKSPTALVAASRDDELCGFIEKLFVETPFIHIERSHDILGVEYSSIFKNSLAILLGMANGLGYKKNTLSIIFVNALKEIRLLGEKMGIEDETILSYAGLGDLYLTGGSMKSRNYTVGNKIGKQNKMTKKVVQIFSTIEGLKSVEFLQGIASHHQIDLPLNTILYEIIYLGREPRESLNSYLSDFCAV